MVVAAVAAMMMMMPQEISGHCQLRGASKDLSLPAESGKIVRAPSLKHLCSFSVAPKAICPWLEATDVAFQTRACVGE